jgi:hypothetical protein
MRRLSHTPQDTVIEVSDLVGGCTHVVYARQPTDRERFLYEANRYERQGNTIYDRLPRQRRHYGRQVITGFDKGTLGDEEGRLISSDPQDPDYRQDWAELIGVSFPQLFDEVARVMFEATRTVPTSQEERDKLRFEIDGNASGEPADDEQVEELDGPLGRSSGERSG